MAFRKAAGFPVLKVDQGEGFVAGDQWRAKDRTQVQASHAFLVAKSRRGARVADQKRLSRLEHCGSNRSTDGFFRLRQGFATEVPGRRGTHLGALTRQDK